MLDKIYSSNRQFTVLIRLNIDEKNELERLMSLSDEKNRSEFIRKKIFADSIEEQKEELTEKIIEKLNLIIKNQEELKKDLDFNRYLV